MSFSFVRGFICSAFGPLNPNHLPKIFPFPVRALDNMASRWEEDKGINEWGGGKKGEIPWNWGWTSSIYFYRHCSQMDDLSWLGVSQVGQLLKRFRSMQVPTQLRWRLWMIMMLLSNWNQQFLWGKLLGSSMGHMTGLAKWPRSNVYFPLRRV